MPRNPFLNNQELTTETDASIVTSVTEHWNTARSTNTTGSTQQTNNNCWFAKPIKLPDDYVGRTCLRDYLQHFDRCALINAWISEESAVFCLQHFMAKPKNYYMVCHIKI